MRIPITRPSLTAAEAEAVVKVLETGWVSQGPRVAEFEEAFARYVGAGDAVATSSCTTALHLALVCLGIEEGDEVLVPAFTFVATANAVEYCGATPVFVDIDLASFNMDVEQIETKITERTKAIIPVHLFGLSAEMDPIMAIARKHELWVVEDAACALGAWYHGRHVGAFGEMSCFSFHPRKSITTGEGGMLTTRREELARLARSLRDHGASRSDLSRHTGKAGFLLAEFTRLGYNYRMTDIQGAMGCTQMKRLDEMLTERSRRAKFYDDMLAGMGWLQPPVVPEGCRHGYQAYVCLFRPEPPTLDNVERLHRQRNEVMKRLEAAGIATRQGTHAPVILGYYAQKYGLQRWQFPHAYLADRLSLTLPLYVQLTDAEQEFVCQALQEAIDAQVAARALG